jgi:EAL domain-containing protein (putative c-di-GMP-specific phosphodiesterase class I)
VGHAQAEPIPEGQGTAFPKAHHPVLISRKEIARPGKIEHRGHGGRPEALEPRVHRNGPFPRLADRRAVDREGRFKAVEERSLGAFEHPIFLIHEGVGTALEISIEPRWAVVENAARAAAGEDGNGNALRLRGRYQRSRRLMMGLTSRLPLPSFRNVLHLAGVMLKAMEGEAPRLDHGLYPGQGLGSGGDAGAPHGRIEIHQYGQDHPGLSGALSQGLDAYKAVHHERKIGAAYAKCDHAIEGLGGQHRRSHEQGPYPGLGHYLRLPGLGHAEPEGAGGPLAPRHLRALVHFSVRPKAQAVARHEGLHGGKVALEGAALKHERRRGKGFPGQRLLKHHGGVGPVVTQGCRNAVGHAVLPLAHRGRTTLARHLLIIVVNSWDHHPSPRRECQDMERDATKSLFQNPLGLSLQPMLEDDGAGLSLLHRGQQLRSRFAPLLSRAHGRPVAYRATVHSGGETALFAGDDGDLALSTAISTLHMRQFQATHKGAGAWLVLPVPGPALQDATLWPPVPQDLFASDGFTPSEVMLSVTADSAPAAVLADFARYHRALGFTVELRGLSPQRGDLALLWGMEPELVTLGAAFLPTTEGSPRKLGQLRALITLLHESGAMVGLEGLAQPEALRWALDTPVDLVSGPTVWPWAPPTPTAGGSPLAGPAALPAFEQALGALRTGEALETACATLLYEAGVLRCYVLNDQGEQLVENLSPAGTRSDPRYWPLAQAEGASWAHRPYFRQALAHPGALLVSDPYFSLPDGGPCQTLSASFLCDGQRQVLCCDLELPRPPSALRP